MEHAICVECANDVYLKRLIQEHSNDVVCSVCSKSSSPTIGITQLGKLIEPIMREHFQQGPTVRIFGDDDKDSWKQEGEPISWIVQEVLGQYFDFEAEIANAVIDADDAWPTDGEEPYWDDTSLYVETDHTNNHLYEDWRYALQELKHGQRFFSPTTQALFTKLFTDVEHQKARIDGKFKPVVYLLPKRTELHRARVCRTRDLLADIMTNPFKHVGPPPKDAARAGRMNADGVPVLYCSIDKETCLAEMRPALGNELAAITIRTTKPLRILDFSRLAKARVGKALSYLQPDFQQEVEKRAFLRQLHLLVSQPIVPGCEADYLITQTMAEYLAHVHKEPFDGVLFVSSQKAGGHNVVLFAEGKSLESSVAQLFSIEYVDNSLEFHETSKIEYAHRRLRVSVRAKREVHVNYHDDDENDY